MLKHTHIKETELAKLRILRNELAASTNYEKRKRLREQAQAEVIADYWLDWHTRNQVTQRKGGRAR